MDYLQWNNRKIFSRVINMQSTLLHCLLKMQSDFFSHIARNERDQFVYFWIFWKNCFIFLLFFPEQIVVYRLISRIVFQGMFCILSSSLWTGRQLLNRSYHVCSRNGYKICQVYNNDYKMSPDKIFTHFLRK